MTPAAFAAWREETATILAAAFRAMDPWRKSLCINSCIEQIRMFHDVLPRLGLSVRPVQVDLLVTFPEQECTFASVSDAFRRRLEEKHKGEVLESSRLHGGFHGHLVAIVDDYMLLDPTIGQAHAPGTDVRLDLDEWVAMSEVPFPKRFSLELPITTPSGLEVTALWRTTGRKDYLRSGAWEPEPQALVDAIVDRATRLLPEAREKVKVMIAERDDAGR